MCTVPAHSFWAPTRARVIAAARSMPGVCAVLVSSEPPGTTRTPVCFHPSVGTSCSLSGIVATPRCDHAACLGSAGHGTAPDITGRPRPAWHTAPTRCGERSRSVFAYDYPMLGLFWTIVWFFLWVAWLMLLFKVIFDIFRSKDLGGGGKALWALFVIIVPWL